MSELEAEFEKIPPSKPQQTRFLRSQQDLRAQMLERAAAAPEAAEDGEPSGWVPVGSGWMVVVDDVKEKKGILHYALFVGLCKCADRCFLIIIIYECAPR